MRKILRSPYASAGRLPRIGSMRGSLFGSTSTAGILLGAETSGLAIDFTAPSNRLLIRTSDGKANYLGNAFINDGGPVSFSRASLGTVVDSDGKIKWAPHNLLLASESFDASAWTKTTTTVAANSHAAPNSTTTAETLTASSANGTTLQSYTALAVSYTFGVWLKRKTGTGNIQIAADSGTYTTVTITSDWALYTVTQTPAAGTISAGIRIVTSGDEVYAWGAHLYRSDLGGMQANTSAYPMYNPTPPKNLLGFSEDFSNAAWVKDNGTAVNPVVTANAGVAPNGLTTADRIVFDRTGGTFSRIQQTFGAVIGTNYTFSVWMRTFAGGTANVGLRLDATGVNCVVTGTWTRFSVSAVGPAVSSLGCQILLFSTIPGNDVTADVLVWGAQLSDSASLDAYVPSYGAAPTSAAYYGPRRDFDPVTLACKGLLVEEQRTNLLLNSATLSTQNVTVTAVVHTLSFYGTGTITLSGTSTAGPLVGTGANSRVSLTFTPTAGTLTLTVTGSVTQAQLEAGSFATSYIPTSASQVTRSADVATVSTQAFPYSSSEGTLVVNGSFLSLTAAGIYGLASLSTGSSGNSVNLFASPPNIIANIYAASAQTANYSIGTLTDPIKAAIAYKVNDVNAAVNGVAQTTDTSAAMPTGIDRLEIGRFWTSQTGNGWIRQITYIPRRLTNAELQTRTT